MDWNYIAGEMETLGLTAFQRSLQRLAEHAFGDNAAMDEEDERMLFYMLGCGTYGTLQTNVQRSLERIAEESGESARKIKKQYWRNRFFPSEEKIKDYYPFFYRHRGLIWLLPFYRVVRGVFVHPKKLWLEWKNVKGYKEG
jgi:hypothetical protein